MQYSLIIWHLLQNLRWSWWLQLTRLTEMTASYRTGNCFVTRVNTKMTKQSTYWNKNSSTWKRHSQKYPVRQFFKVAELTWLYSWHCSHFRRICKVSCKYWVCLIIVPIPQDAETHVVNTCSMCSPESRLAFCFVTCLLPSSIYKLFYCFTNLKHCLLYILITLMVIILMIRTGEKKL